jgi:hypothetical protein
LSYQYDSKRRPDIYAQVECVACRQSIFADQATQNPEGKPLCQHCFLKSVMARNVSAWERRVPGTRVTALHLIELLSVIAIIGLLVSAAIPSFFQTNDAAEANKARLDFYGSYNTDIAELAANIQLGIDSWELLLEGTSAVAAVAPEDQEEFEAELLEYRKFDSSDEQKGAIIGNIQRWKQRVAEGR